MSCIFHFGSFACPDVVGNVVGQTIIAITATLFTFRCPLTDWCVYPDNRAPLLQNNQQFDYIVIGAGSAGSVVASRLSENKSVTVLVLEAGQYPNAKSEVPSPMISNLKTDLNWKYETQRVVNNCEGYLGEVCRWPSGRGLGGSSSVNGMLYVRGRKEDYDGWQAAGNDNWGYDSIVKYFLKNEKLVTPQMLGSSKDLYGSNGDQAIGVYVNQQKLRNMISEAALQLGVATNEAEGQLGFFNALQTIDLGVRANAGKEFLGKHKDRSNLIVSLNSHVKSITFDGNIATGVIAAINSKQLTIKAKREVIVSAGSIKSPVILLNSGIGPREHLEQLKISVKADLPVGKNLHDHLAHYGFFVTMDPKVYQDPNPVTGLFRYLKNGEGPLGTTGSLGFMGFINTKSNTTNFPNIQYHFVFAPEDDTILLPDMITVAGFKKEMGKYLRKVTKHRAGLFIWTTLLHPKSRGEIKLNPDDPQGTPLIYPRYMSNNEDTQVMLEGIRFAEKLIETPPFKAVNAKIEKIPIECDDFQFRSDDYWICSLQKLGSTIFHPVGTNKMGQIENGGVVDSRLRVHGLQKLRVIDASIIPNITTGNTNGPVLMIGQKGGDMVIEGNY